MKRSAATGAKAAPSAIAPRASFRRESSIFGTPSVASVSRPPSSMSDASSITKERRISDSSSAPPRLSLTRGVRPIGTSANAATRRSEASVPPSALKVRTSPPSAAPARPSSMLSRGPSANPAVKAHRRPSSSLESLRNKTLISSRDLAASASEKENVDVDATPTASKAARRMSVVVSS